MRQPISRRTWILAALLLCACRCDEPLPPGTLRVTFIDVHEGDAILIQADGKSLLVDTGPSSGCANLEHDLSGIGTLQTLFITHPHADHFGCAAEVLERYDVKQVVTNGESRGPPRERTRDRPWDEFVETAQSKGLKLTYLPVGTVLHPVPGMTLSILATGDPHKRGTPDGSDINNDSLVMKIEYAGRRILLPGDVETEADRSLVHEYCFLTTAICPSLRADVLKVPHHGSANFDPAFYAAVHPSFAVISADYHSEKHYLPRADAIRDLLSLGAHVYSTSAEGTGDVVLTVSPDGDMTWKAPSQPDFAWSGFRGHEEDFPQ